VSSEKCIKKPNILLIDDVLTTGATASEAALALKNAGANKVYVLTLANWPPDFYLFGVILTLTLSGAKGKGKDRKYIYENIKNYLLKEFFGALLLALGILTFVMLLGNLIKITELVINKGVDIYNVAKLFFFMTPYLLTYTCLLPP